MNKPGHGASACSHGVSCTGRMLGLHLLLLAASVCNVTAGTSAMHASVMTGMHLVHSSGTLLSRAAVLPATCYRRAKPTELIGLQ
jgi:hypothetical protein